MTTDSEKPTGIRCEAEDCPSHDASPTMVRGSQVNLCPEHSVAPHVDEAADMIASLRDEARHSLRAAHLQELSSVQAQQDPVSRAHHSGWYDRLSDVTPDDPGTTERIDGETVRLLRDASVNHADPVIQQRAKDALRRLRVPLTDPAIAAKAAALEAERESDRRVAEIYKRVNSPRYEMTRDVLPKMSAADLAALADERSRMSAIAWDRSLPDTVRASARGFLARTDNSHGAETTAAAIQNFTNSRRPVSIVSLRAEAHVIEAAAKSARMKAMANDPSQPFDIRASARKSLGDVR